MLPGEQESALVQGAEVYINEALRRVNRFHDLQWVPYRLFVQSTPVNLFKEYPPLLPVEEKGHPR